MTVGEKARLDSAVEHVGRIIDRLITPAGDSPFLSDMKVLRNELNAVPGKSDTAPEKSDTVPGRTDMAARKLGEQLGSAVSGLVGEHATVNVYVTVNGK